MIDVPGATGGVEHVPVLPQGRPQHHLHRDEDRRGEQQVAQEGGETDKEKGEML